MAAGGTVIDSLTVTLALDPKQWTKGQREALDLLSRLRTQSVDTAKQVESETKRVGNVLSDFRREAITTLGVLMGGRGIKETISYITTLDATTGRLALTMGDSAEKVSEWQGAIKQVGGSTESANAALAGMSGEMNRFVLTGQSSMLPVLSRLGLSLFDHNRKLKTSSQLWLEVADAVKGMSAPEATAFLSMLPGANQDMINLLLKGRAAIEQYLKAAREAGGTTKQSAAAAEEYQRSLANIERSATSLGRTLTNIVAPALSKFFDFATEGLNSLRDTPKERKEREAEHLKRRGGVTTTQETRARFGELPQWLKDALNRGKLAEWLGKDFFEEKAPAPQSETPKRLPVKPGAGTASPAIDKVSEVLSGVPGIKRVTAMNDPYHAFLGGAHPAGRAIDVTINDPSKSGEMSQTIKEALAARGIRANVRDEYRNPSSHATGGHIHIGLDPVTAARLGGGAAPGARGAAAGAAGGVRWPGVGAGGSTSVTIGTLQVNAPQARDAEGISRALGPALERVVSAGAANQGPQ